MHEFTHYLHSPSLNMHWQITGESLKHSSGSPPHPLPLTTSHLETHALMFGIRVRGLRTHANRRLLTSTQVCRGEMPFHVTREEWPGPSDLSFPTLQFSLALQRSAQKGLAPPTLGTDDPSCEPAAELRTAHAWKLSVPAVHTVHRHEDPWSPPPFTSSHCRYWILQTPKATLLNKFTCMWEEL